jgi:GntR family transcriptional regulator
LRIWYRVGIVSPYETAGEPHELQGTADSRALSLRARKGIGMAMEEVLPLAQLQAVRGGPLYLKLKNMIEDAVVSGRLKHGDALPAERDIADEAAISRVTVRKAIDDLVDQGLLVRRRGSGTFVVKPVPRMQQALTRLTSFSEDMRRRGMVPGSRWLDRGIFEPTSEETMTLGLAGSARVARLTRLRTANDMPIALERTSLADDMLPDPDLVENSLYQALAQRNIRPVRANQRICAVLLKDEETELLGVPPGSAALSVQRIAYLEGGRVMEVSTALYRSDAYDLVAELTIGA